MYESRGNAGCSGNIWKNLDSLHVHCNENALVILTPEKVSASLKAIASLGSGFSFMTLLQDLPVIETLVSLEKVVSSCSTYSDSFFMKQHVNALRKDMFNLTLENQQYTATQTYLAKLMQQAKDFLKYNKNIVVIPADKGGKIVIMQRSQYESRVNTYLEENILAENYREVVGKTLPDIQTDMEDEYDAVMTEMNQYLRADIDLKVSGSDRIRLLKPEPFIIPLFYGNPKIHKNGEPIRPIISSIDMIGDDLSKWILDKLNLIAEKFNIYNVKNSEDLVKQLKNFTLEQNHHLVLYDYTSMFTNIELRETIDIIAENYYLIEATTYVPLHSFIRALEFFVEKATVFQYGGRFYKQCKGLAMGNRLAQVLAEIRTNVALIQAVKTFNADEISFIFKYVDDIFAAIRIDLIDEVHRRISRHVGGMELTKTVEDENCEVEYLDCAFRRDPERMTLTHRWSKKSYGSFATLNYHSNHSWNTKENTIKELIRHAHAITTDNFMHRTNILIKTVLTNSSYPDKYIAEKIAESKMPLDTKMIQKEKNAKMIQEEKNVKRENRPRYVSCPYFIPLKNSLMVPLRENSINVVLAQKPVMTTRNLLLTKVKDRRTTMSIKNAVFKLFCNDCDYESTNVTGNFDVFRTMMNVINDPCSDIYGHLMQFPLHTVNKNCQILKSFERASDAECVKRFMASIGL